MPEDSCEEAQTKEVIASWLGGYPFEIRILFSQIRNEDTSCAAASVTA